MAGDQPADGRIEPTTPLQLLSRNRDGKLLTIPFEDIQRILPPSIFDKGLHRKLCFFLGLQRSDDFPGQEVSEIKPAERPLPVQFVNPDSKHMPLAHRQKFHSGRVGRMSAIDAYRLDPYDAKNEILSARYRTVEACHRGEKSGI